MTKLISIARVSRTRKSLSAYTSGRQLDGQFVQLGHIKAGKACYRLPTPASEQDTVDGFTCK